MKKCGHKNNEEERFADLVKEAVSLTLEECEKKLRDFQTCIENQIVKEAEQRGFEKGQDNMILVCKEGKTCFNPDHSRKAELSK